MTRTPIGLFGYLLLWLVIFLGKTLYPDVRGFYRGLRSMEDAWLERFREHERLQRFVARTAPWAAAPSGQVLFAYGRDPDLEKIGKFAETTRYLLYPARMFSHATGEPMTISHIAVYDTREGAFDQLPFCHQAGEKNYLCEVKAAERPLDTYRVRPHYQAPDLTVMAQAIGPGQSDPAFLIFAFFLNLDELPNKHGFDLDLTTLLTTRSTIDSSLGEGSVYRLRLLIVEPAMLLFLRFRLLVVDKNGLLSASREYPLVPTPEGP